jgi:hypothetical protein
LSDRIVRPRGGVGAVVIIAAAVLDASGELTAEDEHVSTAVGRRESRVDDRGATTHLHGHQVPAPRAVPFTADARRSSSRVSHISPAAGPSETSGSFDLGVIPLSSTLLALRLGCDSGGSSYLRRLHRLEQKVS